MLESRFWMSALAVCTFTDLGHAQATTLSDDYHAGIYGWSAYGGAYETAAAAGDVSFQASGSASASFDFFFQDVSGPVFLPGQGFSASYHVNSEGMMSLDLGGGDIWDCWVPPDANVLHYARTTAIEEAEHMVLVKKSTGMSNASLVGNYRFVTYWIDWWSPTGPHYTRLVGAASFDGSGTVSLSGIETEVTGGVATSVPLLESGPYHVASDGTFSYGGTCSVPSPSCDVGAVTADGEFGYAIVAGLGQAVGMTLFVRENAAPDLQQLAGRYGFTTHTIVGGAVETCLGSADVNAASATSGSWTGYERYATSSATGVSLLNNSFAAQNLTAVGGALENGTGGFVDDRLWISSNYRYVIGASLDFEDRSSGGMGIGVTLCTRMAPAPALFGSPTAGGAGAPQISTVGFALPGNSAFGFQVCNGLPSGIALLPVATAASTGFPVLGGQIFLDPATLGPVFLVLLDPAGCGVASLPIPNNPALSGLELFSQGVLLDPTTSGGFAMSAAVGVEIGAF